MNGILLCLPVFLPIVAGLARLLHPLPHRPVALRPVAVIIGATTVLAWLAILQCDGSGFTFLRFTDSLHFTLRTDGAAQACSRDYRPRCGPLPWYTPGTT